MLKRITIRELLLLTLLVAVFIIQIRDRLLPNPGSAYNGFRIDENLMVEAARDLDDSTTLIAGQLTGGYLGERMLHRGYALLNCDSAKHSAIVERVKQKVRAMFTGTGWKYTENNSTYESWQVTALKDGTMAQLIFQFTGATDQIQTRKLGIQWAELGYSKRWRFEL
ncbi:MAG: hypothetical protein KDB22_22975 [Planctomycetales bacterium]|nr:hypothetical protein [Planctomycetales bacterium]